MTADDYNYLLPTILDSWLETRIKVKDSLKDRVSVNQTKVDEAVRQLVSFSDRITDHLHNSDGPDDHKIAWSFVLAVYHFELLDFDRTVTEKQRVSIVDDCAMTILCAVLNIDQDKIRSELKTVDALIAYKAYKHHLILVHADADMDRISTYTNLEVESYVRYVRSVHRSS